MGKLQKAHRLKVKKRNEARAAAYKKLMTRLSQAKPVVDPDTVLADNYDQAIRKINQPAALEFLEQHGPKFSE
jgi:hypothetical protein